MPTDSITVVTGGMDEFIRKVDRVNSLASRKRILKSAMTSAMKPIKTGFKRDIRKARAVRSRTLARSIKDKVKVFADGNVFGIVGAERKLTVINGLRINPANYIHLADLGTKPHPKKDVTKSWKFKDFKTNRWKSIKRPNRLHPGAKAKPFRTEVARNYGFIAQWVFAKRFNELLTREIRKQQ